MDAGQAVSTTLSCPAGAANLSTPAPASETRRREFREPSLERLISCWMRGQPGSWRLCAACFVCCLSLDHTLFTAGESVFSVDDYYPRPWWAVDSGEIPQLANSALQLRTDTADPQAFAQDIIVGIARGQKIQTAKAIGYMINANSTYGGGCPNPAPPGAVVEKYLSATCYYIGYVMRTMTANNTTPLPVFNQTLAVDIKLANVSDQYVTSPVLQAYQRCLYGNSSLLQPPSWLGASFSDVSIDSRPNAGDDYGDVSNVPSNAGSAGSRTSISGGTVSGGLTGGG
ncbi:hypothetical protein WJX73_003977 [Symbiochloris irregularis]|uniref:Uncharacterized protein n=1 Tax=Symbiochloris irregularis TaxID=706552 RepID=A0AAW1P4V5_9CHLO